MPSGPKQDKGPKNSDAPRDDGDFDFDIDVDEFGMGDPAAELLQKTGLPPDVSDESSDEKKEGLKPEEAENLAILMDAIDSAKEADQPVVLDSADQEETIRKRRKEQVERMREQQKKYEAEKFKENAERLEHLLFREDYTGVYRTYRDKKSILREDVFTMPKERGGLGGKMSEPDEWGIRQVELDGKFNFLYWSNMMIFSEVVSKWFDAATPFKWVPLIDNGPIALSLIRIKNTQYFLMTDGTIMKAEPEEVKLFHECDGKRPEKVDDVLEGKSSMSDYILIMADKAKAYSRLAVSATEKDASVQLVHDLQVLAQQVFGYFHPKAFHNTPDPNEVFSWLKQLKELLDESQVSQRTKATLFKNMLAAAEAMRIRDLFSDDLLKYKWDEQWEFSYGKLVEFDYQGKRVFSLANHQDELFYKEGQFFSNISSPCGKIFVIKNGNKFNFISEDSPALLFTEQWLDEAIGPFDEMFRIRMGDRWNFVNYDGQLLSAEWFEDARDFDPKTGRALVKMNKKWVWINKHGDVLMEVEEAKKEVAAHATGLRNIGLIVTGSNRESLYFYKKTLSYKLHQFFGDLLLRNPQQAYGLARLFGLFKEAIDNATNQGAKKPIRTHQIGNQLRKHITDLEKKSVISLRHEWPMISEFMRGLGKASLIWGEVRPWPVSLAHALSPVVQKAPWGDRANVQFLIDQMESAAIGIGQIDKEEKRSKLMQSLSQTLKAGNVSTNTRKEMEYILEKIRHNKDVFWSKRRIPVAATDEMPKERKKKVRRREKRAENPALDYKFKNICHQFSLWVNAGQYDMGQKGYRHAIRTFNKLQQENPKYPFNYKIFAGILYRYASNLAKMNSQESGKVTLDAFAIYEKVYRQDKKDPEVNYRLALIKKRIGDTERKGTLLRGFFANGHHKEARKHTKRVLKADPQFEKAIELKKELNELIKRSRRGTRWLFRLVLLGALGAFIYQHGERAKKYLLDEANRIDWLAPIGRVLDELQEWEKGAEPAVDGPADFPYKDSSWEEKKKIIEAHQKSGQLKNLLRALPEEVDRKSNLMKARVLRLLGKNQEAYDLLDSLSDSDPVVLYERAINMIRLSWNMNELKASKTRRQAFRLIRQSAKLGYNEARQFVKENL